MELPHVDGVTHRDVDVGGVRLHLAQAGSGPPLVLLHGWPQHWWSWRRMIAPLAEHYTVLAPDLRGWGWSDAPAGRYAKAEFAADIVALLDSEGIDRARVIGHDWGGYTAFLLGLEYPDRVERIVALDIVPPWPGRPKHPAAPMFFSYQMLLASPLGVPVLTRNGAFVRGLLHVGSGPAMKWSDDETALYADVLRDPARARASAACYRTFLTRELPASLRGGYRPEDLQVETLLLMGAAGAIQKYFGFTPGPRVRVESIAGAGHFLPEEAPEEVSERALAFLA